MNFLNQIRASKDNIFDLRVKLTTGENCYYFFKVVPDRKRLFLTLLTKGNNINLAKYGEILASGYGEPPKKLVAELADKYGLSY